MSALGLGETVPYLGRALVLLPSCSSQAAYRFSVAASESPEGVRELRLAVALGPNSASAHPHLGRLYSRVVLRQVPRGENHYHDAACLMSMGLYDQGLAELEDAVRMAPGQQLYGMACGKKSLIRLLKTEAARSHLSLTPRIRVNCRNPWNVAQSWAFEPQGFGRQTAVYFWAYAGPELSYLTAAQPMVLE